MSIGDLVQMNLTDQFGIIVEILKRTPYRESDSLVVVLFTTTPMRFDTVGEWEFTKI